MVISYGLPSRSTETAAFNFFIVLPEIIAALTFGKIMENYLGNDRLLAVLIGGVLLLSAAVVCLLFVRERKS